MQTQQDLTTDEEIGQNNGASNTDLERQFVHPGYTFKGQTLKPYTAGTDFLFNQVLDAKDEPFTVFMAFIFIHTRERKELTSLCWDRAAFREKLLEWVDSLGLLTIEDRKEAMRLFEDMRGWANKSAIEVVPDPDLPQKKTKAKRQRR